MEPLPAGDSTNDDLASTHDEVPDGQASALVVLAAPVPRTAERVAARFGQLAEAPGVITQGARLPLAGLLPPARSPATSTARCARACPGCAPRC